MNAGLQILSSKPKHIQLSEIIRAQIISGEFKSGDRLQPDRMLAEKYCINARTVAAGLNLLVKEGYLERAPSRGTVVIRDGLQGNKTSNMIPMIMLHKGDVYKSIASDIAMRLASLKLYPMLINESLVSRATQVTSFLDAIVTDQIMPYGFLIDGCSYFPFDFLRDNIDKLNNVVFLHTYHYPERIKNAKYALTDLVEAGRIVARHFIDQGHKVLACLAQHEKDYMGPWSSIQVQIMTGFAEVCRASNVRFSEDLFWNLLHGAPFEKTVVELLDSRDCPTAIFAFPDFFIRSEIIPLLESKNIKPMKDIELIGFYNTHHAEECGFSSICIQEKKMAEAAVKLLTGETTSQEILIKPELIIRGRWKMQEI